MKFLFSALKFCKDILVHSIGQLYVNHLAAIALCLTLSFLAQYKPYYKLSANWFLYSNSSSENINLDRLFSWTPYHIKDVDIYLQSNVLACLYWNRASNSVYFSAYHLPSRAAQQTGAGRLPLVKLPRAVNFHLPFRSNERPLAIVLIDEKNAILLTSALSLYQVELESESLVFLKDVSMIVLHKNFDVVGATLQHFWVCLEGNSSRNRDDSTPFSKMWCRHPHHMITANVRYSVAGEHQHNQETREEHSVTFLYSLNKGKLFWSSLDVAAREPDEQVIKNKVSGSSFWKLTLKERLDSNEHHSEQEWTQYKESVLQHMPHVWSSSSDTQLFLTRLFKGEKRPKHHQHRDHLQFYGSPSHLGLRASNGLHFFALSSGVVQTRVNFLQRQGATYFWHQASQELAVLTQYSILRKPDPSLPDSSGDAVEDEDAASSASKLDCGARVVLLSNPNHVVFSASDLCASGLTGWQDFRLERNLNDPRFGHAYLEDEKKAVAPLVLSNRVSKAAGLRGVAEHLIGSTAANQESTAQDYVVLFSDGYLSSYSTSELANWHVKLNAKWLKSKSSSVEYTHFRPSMTLRKYKGYSLAVVIGWRHADVIDLSNGEIFVHHSLPCSSIALPTFLTADNDEQHMEFIIQCSDKILGFSVLEEMPRGTVLLLAIALLLSYGFVAWLCQPDNKLIAALLEDI